jgi:chromobox protein 1
MCIGCYENGKHLLEEDDLSSTADNYPYNAEMIVMVRNCEGKDEFLVKWEGYPATENTWEPAESFADKSIIESYYIETSRARKLERQKYFKSMVL